MKNSNDAMAYAIERMGRNRKDKSGTPYVFHMMQVCANAFAAMAGAGFEGVDDVAMQAAILHDTVEDTPTSLQDLRDYGFGEDVVQLVDYLTHPDGLDYHEYILRLMGCPDHRATLIKLADLQSNTDLGRGLLPVKLEDGGELTVLDPDRCNQMRLYYCAAEMLASETPVELAGAGAAMAGLLANLGRITLPAVRPALRGHAEALVSGGWAPNSLAAMAIIATESAGVIERVTNAVHDNLLERARVLAAAAAREAMAAKVRAAEAAAQAGAQQG